MSELGCPYALYRVNLHTKTGKLLQNCVVIGFSPFLLIGGTSGAIWTGCICGCIVLKYILLSIDIDSFLSTLYMQ